MNKTTLPLPDAAIIQIDSVFESQPSWHTPETNLGPVDRLFWACQQVAQANHLECKLPLHIENKPLYLILEAIADSSGFRIRKVELTSDWWNYDNGPLLGFQKETGEPYALLPQRKGGYLLIDPLSHESKIVTADLAKTLALEAFYFYPIFPSTVLSWRNLLQFALNRHYHELISIILLQVLINFLGLMIPIATGFILDTVVPNAMSNLLVQLVILLSINALVIILFNISQSITLIRIRYKIDSIVQPAIWDRLLRVPVKFFRQFMLGDLADRASGIDRIQQIMTSAMIMGIVSGLLSIITLGLMFYYNVILTLAVILLAITIGLIFVATAFRKLKYQRVVSSLQGKISGFVLQILSSISKLRISNAELRAFTLWSRQYAEKSRFSYKAGNIAVRLGVFNVIFGVVALMTLFAMAYLSGTSLSFGSFIAFNAAFSQFFAAILGMTGLLVNLVQVVPLYERLMPILQAESEEVNSKNNRDILVSGQISVENLSFRYQPNNPLLFDNLSLEIKAGTLVAIVGPTGAGKSTLFRLLLGFEQPTQGSIFYESHNLLSLNIRNIRQQIGVVLQNGTLMPGSVYDNIAGNYVLTEDEAWEIAQTVALDKDIEAMPMKMHTLITEGGKTFSAGQRQRLMIARAIAHHPRILLLDEATMALDNLSQTIVLDNLAKLQMTRIVIAHRLSTLVKTNHIYVLDHGKIIQSGTYEKLMAEEGLFKTMAQQQIL